MANIQLCRICLSYDIRMHSMARPLQQFYEKITSKPFNTEGTKDSVVCYICYHLLRKSYKFAEHAIKADEVLQDMRKDNIVITANIISNIHKPFTILKFDKQKLIDVTEKRQKGIKRENEDNYMEHRQLRTLEIIEDTENQHDEIIPLEAIKMEVEADDVLESVLEECEPRAADLVEIEVVIKPDNDRLYSRDTESSDANNVPLIQSNDGNKKLVNNRNKKLDKKDIRRSKRRKQQTSRESPKKCAKNTKKDNKKVQTQSINKPLSCNECGKQFKYASFLKIHSSVHENVGPFTCTVCGRTFVKWRHLQTHLRAHRGNNTHTCKKCGGKFTQLSTFRYHMLEHSDVKPFPCSKCDKTFSFKGNLTVHLQTHSSVRPYTCIQCGKEFTRAAFLTRHMKMHEDVFTCAECGEKFGISSQFTEHLRTHAGFKPFECNKCGEHFSKVNYLTIHLRTHTG